MRHSLADQPRRKNGHKCTAARPHADLDQAVRLEHPQCVANGDAAHAELLRQITLGRELIAGAELSFLDRPLDLLDDVRGDSTRADRCEELRHRSYGKTLWYGRRSSRGGEHEQRGTRLPARDELRAVRAERVPSRTACRSSRPW